MPVLKLKGLVFIIVRRLYIHSAIALCTLHNAEATPRRRANGATLILRSSASVL